MIQPQIISQYEQLPEIYQREAQDFIEFLLSKFNSSKKMKSKSRGGLGIAKGKYNMADDFDAPLDAQRFKF